MSPHLQNRNPSAAQNTQPGVLFSSPEEHSGIYMLVKKPEKKNKKLLFLAFDSMYVEQTTMNIRHMSTLLTVERQAGIGRP